MPAHESLLVAVGRYFSANRATTPEKRIYMTNKAPLYFQHNGHSMTIVGIEVRASGSMNLVVFDPMFNPSPAVKKLVGSANFRIEKPESLLRAHRRGVSYLSKYDEFELLMCSEDN